MRGVLNDKFRCGIALLDPRLVLLLCAIGLLALAPNVTVSPFVPPANWVKSLFSSISGSAAPAIEFEPPQGSRFQGTFRVWHYPADQRPFRVWAASRGSLSYLRVVQVQIDRDVACGQHHAHELAFVTENGSSKLSYVQIGLQADDGGTILASYERPEGSEVDPAAMIALQSPCPPPPSAPD